MTAYCAGIMVVVSEEGKDVVIIKISAHLAKKAAPLSQNFYVVFPLSGDFLLMKPPAEAFISEHFHVSMFLVQTFTCFIHSK